MSNLDDLLDFYSEIKVQQKALTKTAKKSHRQLRIKKRKLSDLKEIHQRWVDVHKKIQAMSSVRIESIVTMAIQSVFGPEYRFKLKYEEKRNTVYANPIILYNDEEFSPKEDMGGGMLDIIGFSLRIARWSMTSPRPRNIFILDEPFRFCGELTPIVAAMLKKLSKELGFQVILVTHDSRIMDICDRTWAISNGVVKRIRK